MQGGVSACTPDRVERPRTQVFAHPWSASYLINPVLLEEVRQKYFRHTRNQKTLSTGMTAVAFAQQICGSVHLYGFGNGSCGDSCYHYYDCGPTAGSAGIKQSKILTDPRTSGGFHNFSAQAVCTCACASSCVWHVHGTSGGFHNVSAQAVALRRMAEHAPHACTHTHVPRCTCASLMRVAWAWHVQVALRQMAAEGQIVPHWGRCDHNLGEPPPGYLPTPGRRGGRRRAGKGKAKGRGGWRARRMEMRGQTG